MVYYILVLKEVVIVLLLLAFLSILLYSFLAEQIRQKERVKRMDGVAEKILELASDDKPIMLNVSQERLIERVADEVERRSLGRE